MARFQRNDNFIDKTFTIMADILLKVFPASQTEKEAFLAYRDGLSAQTEGEYAEALEHYYEALQLEESSRDRGIIVYNIGLIYARMGNYLKAIDCYQQAIDLKNDLEQGYNNLAIIYHSQGLKASKRKCSDLAKTLFHRASVCWMFALDIQPNSYLLARNWLITTNRYMNM